MSKFPNKLEKLKGKRNVHREQLEVLIEKIDTYLIGTGCDVEGCEIFAEQLSVKSEVIEMLNNDIDKMLNDEDAIKNEILEIDKYNESLISTKVKLQNKIKTLRPETSSIAESTTIRNVSSNINKTAKLPKLSIPRYYGEPSEYLEFYNQFENSIDKNPTLTEIDKFCYLKSLLGGKALSCIKGFSMTAQNYSAALKLISDTFGQKDILINAHMSNLLNLSPVKNSSNLQVLRNLYFDCQTQIRCLESLGVDSKTYSTLLTNVILKLIPPDLNLEFSKTHINSSYDLKELMTFLFDAINSRERAFRIQPCQTERGISSSSRQHLAAPLPNQKRNVPKSATELFTSSMKECIFCSQNHASRSCLNSSVEEKRNKLIREKRCLLCCETECRVRICKKGPCTYCNGKHARAICFRHENDRKNRSSDRSTSSHKTEKNTVQSASNSENKDAVSQTTSSNHVMNEGKGILLQCVKTKFLGNKSSELAFCLFDNGSEKSFIRKDLSERLGLQKLGSERLCIYSFGAKVPKRQICNRVEVKLRNVIDGKEVVIEALEIDEISRANINLANQNVLKEVENKGFTLTYSVDDLSNGNQISLLIGSDFYWNLTKGIERLNSSLVVMETSLGWSVVGNCSDLKEIISVNLIVSDEDAISVELRKFWELENLGLNDKSVDFNVKEQQIIRDFNDSVCFEDGRYRVKLPWKPGMREVLEDNRGVAYRRFEGLIRRFRNNETLFKEYKAVIDRYLEEGIVEYSSVEGLGECPGFYLPHHAVVRNDKSTTRLRVVFDGSSHEIDRISLNEALFTGPNLHPPIFELLLKFRESAIAFIADVKQAFLQIEIDQNDKIYTRFFWTDSLDSDKTFVLNFKRLPFGLRPSPYLLAATLKYHFERYKELYPETANLLLNSVYVDDLIGGKETVSDALRTTNESILIFKEAGMHLRKWQTNSPELRAMWQDGGIEMEPSKENLSVTKVLGLTWDTVRDELHFDNESLVRFASKSLNTKRFILQVVGRIFDPIGILAPFVIRIKCILQKIWTAGVDWDNELPEELCQGWKTWCSEIQHLSHIRVPRYYLANLNENDVSFQVHCFSDASTVAYGTVLYLRVVSLDNQISTSFICSKSRVAPIKSLTLPRLELMGALLSARLSNQVSKCLKFNASYFFWTDSKITYYWIKGDSSKFKPFVKNRVEEIQSLTDPLKWAHCPGKENPADSVSRGLSATNLANNSLWRHGPTWLSQPPEFWPSANFDSLSSNLDPDQLELKSKFRDISQNEVILESREKILNVDKFCGYLKLLRVTAFIFRFVHNARNTLKRKGALETDELKMSEEYWIKEIQKEAFGPEIIDLERTQKVSDRSKIRSLVPYLDARNILRIKGRLDESELSLDEKQPILLPKNSRFSELLILQEHTNNFHSGVTATLVMLRRRFWIAKGRQLVKRVISKCLICRKYSLKPANQITAQLPKDRLLENPPFEICGLDFAGPILYRCNKEVQKAYFAIFTCAVTRGIHLELVSSMSTKHFLLAFRRFISRRGSCSVVYSDNAKSFKAANKDLMYFSNILKDSEFKDFISSRGINWKYIVERAPWWGGFYERLVKSVKDPLRKILGKALLTFEELATILTEIEYVVNSRPLTYVTDNFSEPSPLTPLDFLQYGRKNHDFPLHFAELVNRVSNRESMLKRKQYQTTLLKHFWTKWKEQYLLDLKTARHFKSPDIHKEVKTNDVVLVEGSSKSKLLWDLGIVQETLQGRDGHVRACIVKTKKGLFRKPVQLIYPFELNE